MKFLILKSPFMFLLVSFFSSLSAQAEPNPRSVTANKAGIEAFKQNSPTQAQGKFIEGLSSSPFEAKLHLNLGLTFEVLGQSDKAQASYETALKYAQDDQTRFTANFNMGEMHQKVQKKDEALAFYQEALKYDPGSVETKTNIELLTQDGKGGKGGDQDQKDQKDQNKDGKGQDQQNKDQRQDQKDQKDKNQQGQDQKKEYAKNKPQPQKFKSEELTQGDVNKILGEIKQQEQKIRADFNKREVKDQPRDQDW